MKTSYILLFVVVMMAIVIIFITRSIVGNSNISLVDNDRVLVLFSGGVDSTAALLYLLLETQYRLHVHHIVLVDSQNRWLPERDACQKIVQYCRRKLRPFLYTENIYTNPHYVNNNMDVQRFVAGQLVHRAIKERDPYKWIATGRIKTDLRGQHRRRDKSARAVFAALMTNVPIALRPVFWFPLVDKEKQEVVEYIKKLRHGKLLKMTWSCRYPDYDSNTGHYHKCKECTACTDMMTEQEKSEVQDKIREQKTYRVNREFIDRYAASHTTEKSTA